MEKKYSRPIVLHVEEIDFRPKAPETGERITVIDIEVTEEMAKEISRQIQKRLENEKFISAIRFRLSGRIVTS